MVKHILQKSSFVLEGEGGALNVEKEEYDGKVDCWHIENPARCPLRLSDSPEAVAPGTVHADPDQWYGTVQSGLELGLFTIILESSGSARWVWRFGLQWCCGGG